VCNALMVDVVGFTLVGQAIGIKRGSIDFGSVDEQKQTQQELQVSFRSVLCFETPMCVCVCVCVVCVCVCVRVRVVTLTCVMLCDVGCACSASHSIGMSSSSKTVPQ
jgi:hypothetical protein